MLAVAQPASKESAGKKPAPNPLAGAPIIETEAPEPALQRKTCPCGGGCPRCLQTKITVNTPGDQYEEEADRVAEEVMRMQSVPRPCSCGGGCPKCQAKADELQMKSVDSAAPCRMAAPPIVHDVLRTPGHPLDPAARSFMEPRFGRDFSHVRIHADSHGAQSADAVGAQAYTVGPHIVFAMGRYNPTGRDGQSLLAHELTHVVQQSGGTLRLARKRYAEQEADVDLVPLQGRGGAQAATGTAQAGTQQAPLVPQPDLIGLQGSPPRTHTPVHAAESLSPQAPPTELNSGAPVKAALGAATDTGTPANSEQAAPVADPPAGSDSSMPRLTALLTQPHRQAIGRGPGAIPISGVALDGISQDSELARGALLGTLALGASEARKTINDHSSSARSDVDWHAKMSSKKLDEQTKAADETVRALADKRRDQIDRTILAHDTQIGWLEKQCKADASTHADNAKKAQTEGFASHRLNLADAFDWWVRRFEKLNQEQSDNLTQQTDKNVKAAWDMAKNYDSRYIQSYAGQSEERKEVQHDAVYEVAEDYGTEILKAKTEVLPELVKVRVEIKADLDKGRDAALAEFDKGLPNFLTGIVEQLAAALQDISNKASESRAMLAHAAVQMRERVSSLEDTALKRNAAFRATIDKQIETGRASAAREFRRAVPEAMEPIAVLVDEAVGMLINSDDELDPDASQKFVDEVFDFSLEAADATGIVFAAARDAGVGTLAGTVRFAKRGLAAGKQDLEAALHTEGADNESALIGFSTEAEGYLKLSLTTLDQTFNAAVLEAETGLNAMLNETRGELREPMEQTEKQVRQSFNDVSWQQTVAKRRLGNLMHNAAREAAWRYDHPYLKHVRDTVEVILGFALVLAMVVGLVLLLPAIVGEAAAAVILTVIAMIGAFAIGYFGAKAYDERKKAGASGVSAFFGALADVTGINDVRRAFTDPKMAPFDRGVAWGQFWLNLFGVAEGAPRFLKAIKVRLPKRFTNPFRARGSGRAAAAEAQVLHTTPQVPIPETPKIGFELPHQKLAQPEVSKAHTVSKPGRAGYELPHEQTSSPDATVAGQPDANAISPRLHDRKPATPDAPTPPKRGMGFKRSEEPASIRDMAETPVAGGRRKIGFKSSEEAAVPIDEPSGTHDQGAIGDSTTSGGVISQMPPAREVPSPQRPGSGSAQSPFNQPTQAVDTSVPKTPRTNAGEPLVVETPRQGSIVSKVEPGAPAATQTERPLSAQDEARFADKRLVQLAREERIADEARVKKLNEEFEEIEKIRKELGPRKERDYVDDAHDKTKADLKQAKSDLNKSRRAEAEAEAAERIHLLKRKDVDPAAALHDPEVKRLAQEELRERLARVAQNDEWIKANERDLAEAQAKLAKRQKEFEATRPGSDAGPQSRDLARARDNARQKVESAKKKLDAVKRRTEAAEAANQNHYKRMQDLDRVLNPLDYPEISGEKGNYGEDQSHRFMDEEKGYDFVGSSKKPASNDKPSDKGLDGVYEKRSTAPNQPKHVVAEAKYDQARLRPGQEEANWVDERLDKAVGRDHANTMRKEGYEYWLMKYDPKLRRVVPKKLWEWRHNGKFGPGGKPLGAPHYFPPF